MPIHAFRKLFFLLLFPYFLTAQDTIRHEKRSSLVMLPAITHSIETDWTFGVAGSLTFKHKNHDSLTRTSNLQALALYSLQNQIIAGVNGTIYFPHEKYILVLENSFSRFPDRWWGIGNKTSNCNEERYEYEQFYIYPHLQRKIFSDFYVGILYEYQQLFNVHYGGDFLKQTAENCLPKTTSLFDDQNVAGRYGSVVSGLGFSLTWDSRPTAFSPHRGLFAQMKYNNFNKIVGTQFEYWNISLDVRKFIPITKKTTLALQGYAFLNEGDVPIRSLATLGGNNNMRGYYDGRFRDKNQITFQAEYRFPIWWRFGGTAFACFGDVSDKLKNFDLSNFKRSGGLGLRFALNPKEKLNIRVDYGWGQNGSQGLYFYLDEAF